MNISNKLVLVLFGFAAFGFLLWVTGTYGIGLTPDSASYIAAARNIAAGRGAIVFDGSPLTMWPPLYPILLAALEVLLGLDAEFSARLVNAVLFGGIVYLSGLLFLRHLKSRWWAFAGTLFVLLSANLFQVGAMAWSEFLFVFLLLVYLVSFELYQEKARLVWFVTAAMAVGLAAVTRYIGVVLLPLGAVTVFLFCHSELKSKLRAGLIFLAIAIVPTALWAWRTFTLTGAPFGPRGIPQISLNNASNLTIDVLAGWYFPAELVSNRMFLFLLASLFGFIAGAVWVKRGTDRSDALRKLGGLLGVVIAYLIVVVYSNVTMNLDPINERLLSPMYIPIAILVFVFLEKLTDTLPTFKLPRSIWRWALVFGFLLYLILYPGKQLQAQVNNYFMHKGWGWGGISWRQNQVIQHLVTNPDVTHDCALYSNASDVIYLNGGLESKYIPAKPRYMQIKKLLVPQAAAYNGKICVAWLKGIDRSYLPTLEELQSVTDMQKIMEWKDGGLYFFNAE